MKKSKIIVPALAVLLLSTAASVTGTVAWFTANRVFQTSITNFAVTSLDGELDCAFTAGVGTELTDSDQVNVKDKNSKKIIVSQHYLLADASLYGKQLWTNVGDANADATGAYQQIVADVTAANEGALLAATNSYTTPSVYTEKVLWAYTFKMTFGYTYSSDHTPVNLFFDNDSAKSLVTKTNADAAVDGKETYKGFRIAFICGSRTLIWADNQTEANVKQVISTDASDDIATGGFIASDTVVPAKPADKSASQSSRADFIGQIPYAASDAHLDVWVVAWYEGTDPNVISASSKDTVTASMGFYTRVDAPAP